MVGLETAPLDSPVEEAKLLLRYTSKSFWVVTSAERSAR
jgi:hypothetical protein